jgi:DNA repair exonuclease SbcCD nuclease subunit
MSELKIAVINDLHLNIVVYSKIYDQEFIGLPFRQGDFMRSFRYMVDKLVNEIKPDLVVLGGDIYDYYEPTNDVRGFFSEQIARLNVPIIILVGNHDICKKHHALKDIQELKLKNIQVIETPKIVNYKDAQLLLFPYSLDIERKVLTIKEEFNKMVENFHEKKDESKTSYFFGHFGVKGGTLSEYNFRKRETKLKGNFVNDNDKDVSVSDFDRLGADYVIMGDYHKHQILPTADCYAMYTGSIEKTDFSEIDQQKGFIVYDNANEAIDGYGKCRFVEYPNCRPLVELNGTLVDMKQQFGKLDYKNLQKAIVKFKFAGSSDESYSFSLGLREFAKEIDDLIKPVYTIHEQKVTNKTDEQAVTELQEEIEKKGKLEEEDTLGLIKEMIVEREEDEAEQEILKELITQYHESSKGVK